MHKRRGGYDGIAKTHAALLPQPHSSLRHRIVECQFPATGKKCQQVGFVLLREPVVSENLDPRHHGDRIGSFQNQPVHRVIIA